MTLEIQSQLNCRDDHEDAVLQLRLYSTAALRELSCPVVLPERPMSGFSLAVGPKAEDETKRNRRLEVFGD